MKHENVRIGMKVVPHQKTVPGWNSLETSNIWERAKSGNQPYVYVVGFDEDEGCWVLDNENKESVFGDFFFAQDFEPYDVVHGLTSPSKAELAVMDANAEELLNDFTGA